MKDLSRLLVFILLAGCSVFTVSAIDLTAMNSTVLMPGIAAVWKDGGTVPRPGLSLKAVATDVNDGYVAWTSFELRAFYDVRKGTSQIDLSWPGIFGLLYPGVSLEYDDGEVIPWFYGEVDLFYFPFLFATVMIAERPWFIPSVYMGPRFGPAGTGWNAGIRLSVPLPPGDAFNE